MVHVSFSVMLDDGPLSSTLVGSTWLHLPSQFYGIGDKTEHQAPVIAFIG